MMFRGFLRWSAALPEFRQLVSRDAGKAAAVLVNLQANTKRTNAIEAAQLPGWWQCVEQLTSRTASVYLERIEAHILVGAGVQFDAAVELVNLRVVNAA